MSGKVHIVTDSTCDLPRELVERHHITVVPLRVHFGEEVYREGVEITASQFYEKLARSSVLPRTSQPAPGDFVEAYRKVGGDGGPILSLHISSHMSGTCQSALMAAEMLPEYKIKVIDTEGVSMLLGLLVLRAARLAEEGRDWEEIAALIERESKEDTRSFFVVDTLEYLEKNGRIGRAQAFLGTVFNFKPVLGVRDGLVTGIERVRGKSKAVERMLELFRESIPPGRRLWISALHGGAPEEGRQLVERVRREFTYEELIPAEIGPVVGCHAGPGVLAVLALALSE